MAPSGLYSIYPCSVTSVTLTNFVDALVQSLPAVFLVALILKNDALEFACKNCATVNAEPTVPGKVIPIPTLEIDAFGESCSGTVGFVVPIPTELLK